MDSLASTPVFNFHKDSLEYVRKQYNLDQPGRIDQAIDILEEWIEKQTHFEFKTFPRDYLERLIINNKGLLEKAKKKLDSICTLRTLSPDYFEVYDLKKCDFNKIKYVFLPKLTENHHRIGIIKFSGEQFSSKTYYDYFRDSVWMSDYQQTRDYSNGILYLLDFNEANIVSYVMNMNFMELRKFKEIFLEGYCMRMIQIHILTNSKSVEVMMTFFKKLVSEKLNERTFYHKKIDTVYNHIPKDILPHEYGGNEIGMEELHDIKLRELTSKEFTDYKRQMNNWRTNEALRRKDTFNEEYIGISGTFRYLSVD